MAILEAATWSFERAPFAVTGLSLLLIVCVLRWTSRTTATKNVPWGLGYMKFLPRWVSGIIHTQYAFEVMQKASKRHPGKPFKVARHDTDVVVLPPETIEELSGLPNSVASNILALGYDLVGEWSGLDMLNDADLHQRVVQRKITPSLAQLTHVLQDEVSTAVSSYFPQKEGEWVEVVPYPIMNRIAARVFSRLVVGPMYCRDERWLHFSMNFTEDVFKSIMLMRHFPPWTYPIFRYLLPSVKNAIRSIHRAEELLVPIFKDLLEKQDLTGQKKVTGDIAQRNALAWLCELAVGEERDPKTLVHSQILLALGAVHTSLFAELNTLYDLMANPAEMEAIKSEIAEVAEEVWTSESYAKLHKLDSVLRESQRLAPPFIIGLRRVMKQDYTFANGISIKEGAYVCVLTSAVQDTHLEANEDPDRFYGLRSYDKKCNEDEPNSTKHLFTTADSSVLGFGYGRTACPGRFAASLLLKVFFAKLLTEYDFAFVEPGAGRPKSVRIHEVIAPDPAVKIRIRKRKDGTVLF